MDRYKIGELCHIIKGLTPIMKAVDGEYPLVVTAEERKSHSEWQFNCNAVCVPLVSSTGHGHASIKRIHYQSGKFALGNILAAIIPMDEAILDAEYLFIFLSLMKDEILVPLMKGTANVSLTVNALKTATITVPTIQKQLEIVNKINKFSEYKLNLYKCCDIQEIIVDDLRLSILQEAIQGKLVPQDPKDEPVSVILKKIKADKEKLISEKKLRNEKAAPSITEDEVLYELPQGWEWARLGEIVALRNGSIRRGPFGSAIRKDMFVARTQNTYKVYEQGNAIRKSIDYGEYYIDETKFKELRSFEVVAGDIIISCAGTIGETYLLPENSPKGIINQALLKLQLNNEIILDEYFLYLFKSLTKLELNEAAKGSVMKNLVSIDFLKNNVLFPLPPLEEQIRMVEKVDQLMELCDELNMLVEKSRQESELLMQSVLHEAFNMKYDNYVEFPSKKVDDIEDLEIAARSNWDINSITKGKIKNRVTDLLGKSM